MESDALVAALGRARWVGRDPEYVPEFDPPEFDDRPNITRDMEPVRLLRTEFPLHGEVARARVALSARGLYRGFLGAERIGQDQLTPGWTDYRRRIHYQTYDVTSLLTGDRVAWCLELADGWYAGYLGMDRRHQAGIYGTGTSAVGALVIEYRDGRAQEVVTGSGWMLARGDTVYADLLMGQFTDLTRRRDERLHPGFDGDGFEPAWCDPHPPAQLRPQEGPPVRVLDTIGCTVVARHGQDRTIVDFGRNLVGRVRLRLGDAPAGARIHIRHGEALDGEELYTANLRTARAHDIVVARGRDETWEPEFTFHGFRYAEIRGLAGLRPDDVTATVIGSDVAEIGTLECSDSRLELLERNIARTVRSNLVSVPTDCPQRDERLGWMADAQLIMRTASHQFDLGDFVAKWLVDIRDGQAASGAYPDVAPRAVVEVDGAPGWADAGVLVPWTVALFTGRLDLLSNHHDSMVRFMDHLDRENPDGIREHALNRNYGDWLSLQSDTPKTLVATAYWKLCADAMIAVARVLDLSTERWEQTSRRIASAFQQRFLAPDGRIGTHTQTGYALAITAGLVPQALLPAVGDQLEDAVRARGTQLTTGIHGLRAILPALVRTGRLSLAYELLLRDEYPSWLYPVQFGATTIWERWDGYTQDRGFQTPAMNSLNHYALGSVGEWMYEWMAGLRPDPAAPGFAHALVRPHPGGGIASCTARRATADGELSVAWSTADAGIRMDVVVPRGRTATAHVPTTVPRSTRARTAGAEGPTVAAHADGWDRVELGAGRHELVAEWDSGWAPTPAE